MLPRGGKRVPVRTLPYPSNDVWWQDYTCLHTCCAQHCRVVVWNTCVLTVSTDTPAAGSQNHQGTVLARLFTRLLRPIHHIASWERLLVHLPSRSATVWWCSPFCSHLCCSLVPLPCGRSIPVCTRGTHDVFQCHIVKIEARLFTYLLYPAPTYAAWVCLFPHTLSQGLYVVALACATHMASWTQPSKELQ